MLCQSGLNEKIKMISGPGWEGNQSRRKVITWVGKKESRGPGMKRMRKIKRFKMLQRIGAFRFLITDRVVPKVTRKKVA